MISAFARGGLWFRPSDQKQDLTEKRLAFALFLKLEGCYRIVADHLMEAITKDDYRMQMLVAEIVRSYPFLNHRIQYLGAGSNGAN